MGTATATNDYLELYYEPRTLKHCTHITFKFHNLMCVDKSHSELHFPATQSSLASER